MRPGLTTIHRTGYAVPVVEVAVGHEKFGATFTGSETGKIPASPDTQIGADGFQCYTIQHRVFVCVGVGKFQKPVPVSNGGNDFDFPGSPSPVCPVYNTGMGAGLQVAKPFQVGNAQGF